MNILEEIKISVVVGYCPKCGGFYYEVDGDMWWGSIKRQECIEGCDWDGEGVLDSYEEYLNKNRYDKLKDILI